MMNVKDVNPSYKIYETMHGRSGALFTVIALGLLILSVTRGLFVIGLGGLVETSMIYNVIFLFLMIFTLYCCFDQQRLRYPPKLKLCLYLNLLFFICWLLPDLIATRDIKFFLICAIVPFVSFGFMKIPSLYLRRVFFFLLFILAATTIIDFIMSNLPKLQLREYREQLRLMINPTQLAPTRVGFFLRSVGITGFEHETSCLLVMLITYVLALRHEYISRSSRIFLIYLSLVALLFTLSISNMIIGFFSMGLICLHYFKRKEYFQTGLLALPFMFFILNFGLSTENYVKGDDISIAQAVYVKIAPDTGDWSAMLTMETDSSRLEQDGTLVCYHWQKRCSPLFNELAGLVIGHEGATKMGEFGRITEIGLIRMAWETGLTTILSFFLVLIFPIMLYFSSDAFTKREMFPYFCAITTGILTLLHYGALFRTTNIFIFYALYGACIRQYILSTNFKNKFIDKIA